MSLFDWLNPPGLRTVTAPGCPRDAFFGVTEWRDYVLCHPDSLTGVHIWLEPGLSYAQRSTMRGLLKLMARAGVKGVRFTELRQRVAYLDGVKP